jgi:hypothetical protein
MEALGLIRGQVHSSCDNMQIFLSNFEDIVIPFSLILVQDSLILERIPPYPYLSTVWIQLDITENVFVFTGFRSGHQSVCINPSFVLDSVAIATCYRDNPLPEKARNDHIFNHHLLVMSS